ncbi:hypothetical protein V8F20_010403 [Naviculisporaceae sp. PSN 640]
MARLHTTHRIRVDVQTLRADARLDLVYYWFGFASFVVGLGTLARLNSLMFIGYLPKTTLIRRPRYTAALIWLGPLVILWMAFCIAVTKEFVNFPTNPTVYTNEINTYVYATSMNREAIFILFLLLCGWIAVLLTGITTDTLRRLVHASRAGILVAPEREAMTQHGVVLLVYLGLNGLVYVLYILSEAILYDTRPFIGEGGNWEFALSASKFWVAFLVEVLGLPLMLLWAGHMTKVLAANSEKMMGVAWD